MEAFQAGGNMGGDVDQAGRPVVDGAWYIEEDGVCVAGPYASEEIATTLIAKWEHPDLRLDAIAHGVLVPSGVLWSDQTFKCQICGRTARVLKEAIQQAMEDMQIDDRPVTEEEAAEGFDFCLVCTFGEEAAVPGEFVDEPTDPVGALLEVISRNPAIQEAGGRELGEAVLKVLESRERQDA